MFRTLIYPSSGALDCAVELLHRRFVVGSLCVGDLVRLGLSGFRVAGNKDTTQTQPHQISNTQRTDNKPPM